MQSVNSAFQYCDQLVQVFEKVINHPIVSKSSVYYTGIDLGTAYIVLAVLDENYQPVAGAYRFANVVKDGMVVDYIGAIRIVKELKQELEEKLGTELLYAAAALPPGTMTLDSGVIKHVVQGAGFEITTLLDEPTAANAVLKIQDGAIVDIGGGTTGITILKDGEVIYVADEPTGGTHFSLVIAGAYKMSFDEAERYKQNPQNHRELTPVVGPVIEKVSSILNHHLRDYQVETIYLVGGTCCLKGIEDSIARQTRIPTYKPLNPMFVTPLGIALSCTQDIL
ncbi:ethanolamine utilization protein EutJ family protein [Desulfitobacterium dehalogenans ATCC 51507]|uniref:Ethanolamine utilization protein EutJ family protein n=1 Tax=Desulfitobacterium dehalogenans (strain ATCC 51507 / DSM 9161 / JW/IU-DC1) TaxID=756499 RepID=I4AER8_DESDJ|nr:ethanolamine utilization protein EutJ [Desulfitobacterium dehalogenans]AFM02453.1 ethanolamine utilization protein EutJ family protein [Desulfitobacterium dehalogenans ATCC 51507]